MALTKAERLQIVFSRLQEIPPADDAQAAQEMLETMLAVVEDQFSGVAASSPPPSFDDGRMYPALIDNIRTKGTGMVLEHRRQVTYLGGNGAILIINRVDGKVVFEKAGSDGAYVNRDDLDE